MGNSSWLLIHGHFSFRSYAFNHKAKTSDENSTLDCSETWTILFFFYIRDQMRRSPIYDLCLAIQFIPQEFANLQVTREEFLCMKAIILLNTGKTQKTEAHRQWLTFDLVLTFLFELKRLKRHSVAKRDVMFWWPFTVEPHNKGSVCTG